MPELPEVETLKRELEKTISGKIIKQVEVKVPKLVSPAPSLFSKELINQKINSIRRRSKMLIFDLSGGKFLLVHLKMTGQLIFVPKSGGLIVGGHPNPVVKQNTATEKLILRGKFKFALNFELPNKYTHIIFTFTDGSRLYYNDLRKFGWMKVIDTAGLKKIHEELGIEPLSADYTFDNFKTIIKRYPNRKIKQLLMDPALIVGVGNIYSDEALFCSRINPFRPAGKIKPAELKNLFNCIPKILKLALSKGGTSADTYLQLSGQPGGFSPLLKVYGREGEKCQGCKGVVERKKIGGRSAHFCPSCQK